MMDLFLTNMKLFTKQDIDWWIRVDYCVFISCLDSHSDGTHSLQSIHSEQVICSNEDTNCKTETKYSLFMQVKMLAQRVSA